MEVCSYSNRDPKTILLKINGTLCNLNCEYCSEIRKEKNGKMSLKFIRELFTKVPQSAVFILHGGEPLMDARYLEKIISSFILARSGRLHIQTNGVFDNDMFRVLLKYRNCIHIGISIDGPEELSSYRVDRDGKPVFKRVDKVIDSLGLEGIEIKCICTVNNKNHQYPAEILRYFLSKENVRQVRLNPCFDVCNKRLAPYAVRPSQFLQFLTSGFEIWLKDSLYSKIRVDPFHAMIEYFLTESGKRSLECANFISIYPDGTCTLCDALGELRFKCRDWSNVFLDAEEYLKTKVLQYDAALNKQQQCEGQCIAMQNRFSCSGELIKEYYECRKQFLRIVKNSIAIQMGACIQERYEKNINSNPYIS